MKRESTGLGGRASPDFSAREPEPKRKAGARLEALSWHLRGHESGNESSEIGRREESDLQESASDRFAEAFRRAAKKRST